MRHAVITEVGTLERAKRDFADVDHADDGIVCTRVARNQRDIRPGYALYGQTQASKPAWSVNEV